MKTRQIVLAAAIGSLLLGAGLTAHAADWKKPTTGITCQNGEPGKGGVINAKAFEVTRATRFYRLYGGVSPRLGGWWTETKYGKTEGTRKALAVCSEWPDGGKSTFAFSVTCNAPVGLKFCRGTTQSASCKTPARGYPKGSAYQIFIPGSERAKLKCY